MQTQPSFPHIRPALPTEAAHLTTLALQSKAYWGYDVAPDAMGRGYGRQLVDHAVATALSFGDETLLIQSDPNAEGFYWACGAELVNYTPSASMAGRMLPTLMLTLQHYRTPRA